MKENDDNKLRIYYTKIKLDNSYKTKNAVHLRKHETKLYLYTHMYMYRRRAANIYLYIFTLKIKDKLQIKDSFKMKNKF